jgi:hypothetical protein
MPAPADPHQRGQHKCCNQEPSQDIYHGSKPYIQSFHHLNELPRLGAFAIA